MMCLSMFLPSGNLLQSYWTWPSQNSWFPHEKWWFFIVMKQFTRGYNGVVSYPVLRCHLCVHRPLPGSYGRSFFGKNGCDFQAVKWPWRMLGLPWNIGIPGKWWLFWKRMSRFLVDPWKLRFRRRFQQIWSAEKKGSLFGCYYWDWTNQPNGNPMRYHGDFATNMGYMNWWQPRCSIFLIG